MPFYRFQIEVNAPPHEVAERLRTIVSDPPPGSFFKSWSRPPSKGFWGSVDENYFRMRRDIRYRNSFLPEVRGQIISVATGSHVIVTMFMHPAAAIFLVFWLGIVGFGMFASKGGDPPFVPVGMCLFAIVLAAGGFFPEAFKAKRMISEAILKSREPIRPLGLFHDSSSSNLSQ